MMRALRDLQEERQPGGEEEDQDDRALELRQQERERIRSVLRLQEIGAIAREPLPGFLPAQSLLGRSKVLEHLRCRGAPEGRRESIHTGC